MRQESFNTQLFLNTVNIYILDYRLSFSHDNGFRTVHRWWILLSEGESIAIRTGIREREPRRRPRGEQGRVVDISRRLFLGEKFNFTKISVW